MEKKFKYNFDGGDGHRDNPLLISNLDQLRKVKDETGFSYRLEKDIDVEGGELDCIESSLLAPFYGIFDGNGYTIKNFTLKSKNSRNGMGLFSCIHKDSIIRNLKISNLKIEENQTMGSIVGYNMGGVIGDCEVYFTDIKNNKNNSGNYLGGIAGQNGGRIHNCKVTGCIEGESVNGGIVGFNTKLGTIEFCQSYCDINGLYSVGGIAGWNYGSIENCLSSNRNVSGIRDVGGLVGVHFKDSSLSKCKVFYMPSAAQNMGYFVGSSESKEPKIIDCELVSEAKEIGCLEYKLK